MSVKYTVANLIPRSLVLEIKYAYHALSRLSNGRKRIDCKYNLITIGKPNTHVYFGYYDISPFNSETDELLYLNLQKNANHVDIICSRLNDINNETIITSSKAWNWQQGVRLRWMPNCPRDIIFNDYVNGNYITRRICLDTKKETTYCSALYDISPDGRYGLSLNFERLGVKRPGYGYTCNPYVENAESLALEGIDLIDLYSNYKERIITYSDITAVNGCESSDYRSNYLNHISFSPSGDKFLFFWLTIDKGYHKAYLLVYDFTSKSIKLLEGKDKVSHFVWEDDDNIIVTAYDEKKKCYYYRYTISSGKKELLSPTLFERDGHPSVLSKDVLLTDTYPDLKGFQKLYKVDLRDQTVENIATFYSDCRVEGEMRTDLHPRLDKNRKLISFDSNQLKYRTLNILRYDHI